MECIVAFFGSTVQFYVAHRHTYAKEDGKGRIFVLAMCQWLGERATM